MHSGSTKKGNGSVGPAGGRWILVADDNAVNQAVVRRILEKDCYQVTVAGTGREAIEALLQRPYDLVFMDVQMPEMDGLQATEAIRSGMVSGIDAKTPVVALTAGGFAGDRQRCVQAGMNDYMVKPVTSADILNMAAKYASPKQEEKPSPSLDTAVAFDRLGDAKLFNLVCIAFFRDVPSLLDNLETSITGGDLKSAERYAHSLKGAAANVGGEKLRDIGLAMETVANRLQKEELLRLLPEARAEVRVVLEALQRHVSSI